MKKLKENVSGSTTVRQQAEKLVKNKQLVNGSQPIENDTLQLVHKLQAHQIELELQNEELKRAKEDAEIVSQKYAEIYDFAPSGFFTLSKEAAIVELNLHGANMLGKSRSVLINRIFTFLVSNDTKSIFNLFLQKIFSTKAKQTCEVTLSPDDSQPIYIYIKGVVSKNGEHCIINAFDISERKKAEEALRESQERNRTIILQTAMDGFWLVDMKGKILEVNETYCRMSGYSAQDIILMHVADLEAFESENETVAHMQKILERGEDFFETRHRRKDGSIFDVEISVQCQKEKGGRFVVFLRDITERKAAREALKQSEERVRYKLQSILSPEGSIANLELNDVIDVPSIQQLMDNFYQLVNIPMAIIDLQGKVLIGVGWQDICTKFHRIHPVACRNCFESDVHLTKGITDGEFMLYKCKNNMWDMATPLIIGGEHKGNLYIGQFFFKHEPIDYTIFSKQAQQYGFDEQEYLDALRKVPRLDKHTIENAKSFFLNLSRSISQLSYSNIKLAKAIIQEKNAKEKLKEKEELLNKAQEIAHLGSWSLDLGNNILTWSEELYRIFDVLPHEFTGTYGGFLELVHPEDRDIVNSAYTNSIIEEKGSYEINHRIFRKHSGELRYVLEKCEHVRDASGKIIRSVGMTHDVTELRQSVEAFRENERLLRESQAAAQIGSYYTDLIQKTWKATPTIYEIFGIDETYPHTLEGWIRCIHPDFREELTSELFQKEKTNTVFEHEYKIIRVSDGAERWVYGHGKFEYDNHMNPVRLIGTIQDITKRKQAEEALKHLNEELENRVRERTEELLNVTFEVEERERNRFSLELHDDLGPLLSTAKLYFQWLAEIDSPEKKKIITEKGNISIDRAIQTTREISHGLGSQIVKNIGFSDAVQNFVRSINDTQKLYIDFKFNTYNRFGNFLEITLYRITTELINNTLKYANATRVEIDFDYNKERKIILFTYSDNGIGFDLTAVEKTNLGHGLMNIKHRINLLSGEIRIETGIGKGMSVYVSLPVDDEMNSNPDGNQELQEITVQIQNMNIL